MRHANKVLAGLVVVIGLFGGYALAYCAMLDGSSSQARLRQMFTGRPAYRVQTDAVRMVFRPAHRVDRILRPERWPEVPCAGDPW